MESGGPINELVFDPNGDIRLILRQEGDNKYETESDDNDAVSALTESMTGLDLASETCKDTIMVVSSRR